MTAKKFLAGLFVYSACCFFAFPIAAAGEEGADNDISILRDTSRAFVKIAEQANGAVVFVSTEKTITRRSPLANPHGEQFDDEFFEEFFGKKFRQSPQPREKKPEQKRTIRGQGSGFIISKEGYILTNNHVVDGAEKVLVTLKDKSEPLEAEVIGADPDWDIAVIKIKGDDFTYLELGDSDELKVGEWVVAIGNPFGLTHTVTAGIVSAKGRGVGLNRFEDFIQTDAAINFGNSGGPLLNIDGKVIGMNSAIVGRYGYSGIGFAIPINAIKNIYDQLITTGEVTKGFIGIQGADVDSETALLLGAGDTDGILVNMVIADSPAEKAGLRHGDIIIALNGKAVDDWMHFRNKVSTITPGTEIKLDIIRKGKEQKISLILTSRKAGIASADSDDGISEEIGITVANLTDELREQFGYEDSQGVIVTEVEPDSPAARKGIRQGMLICEVNREPVKNVQQFQDAVKASEDSVLFYVKFDNYANHIAIKLK